MLAPRTIVSFAGLAFVFALSPGPNLLYLASRSVCQGTAAGFASLAGVCTAMLLYMLATGVGLSALFDAVPVAYDVVRFAGGAYLLWLAVKALRSRGSPGTTSSLPPEAFAEVSQIEIDSDPNAETFYVAMGARRVGVVQAPIEGHPERIRPQLVFDILRDQARRSAPDISW